MNLKRQIHFNSHMGRMGNQMFQYACAKNFAYAHGYTTSLSHLDKLEYFELSLGERFLNKIKSTLFFRLAKPLFGMNIINTELKCMERMYLQDLQQIEKPTMVWGFFQSPEYFSTISDKIKSDFRVKKRYTVDYEKFLLDNGLRKGGYIAIHLRLTDYKGFTVPCLQGDDFTLPVSYYHRAIAQLKSKLGSNLPFVFVSDDPDSVAEIFKDLEDKIISRGSAITDFLVLQNSAHLIMSNSTYAWWAAFLNPKKEANIFCPKYFLGFKEGVEVPIRIYPSNWQQIDV